MRPNNYTARIRQRATAKAMMALRLMILASLCVTPHARMSKAHKKSKRDQEKEKLAEQKRDLGVPRCCGAFTPSTRLVSISQ